MRVLYAGPTIPTVPRKERLRRVGAFLEHPMYGRLYRKQYPVDFDDDGQSLIDNTKNIDPDPRLLSTHFEAAYPNDGAVDASAKDHTGARATVEKPAAVDIVVKSLAAADTAVENPVTSEAYAAAAADDDNYQPWASSAPSFNLAQERSSALHPLQPPVEALPRLGRSAVTYAAATGSKGETLRPAAPNLEPTNKSEPPTARSTFGPLDSTGTLVLSSEIPRSSAPSPPGDTGASPALSVPREVADDPSTFEWLEDLPAGQNPPLRKRGPANEGGRPEAKRQALCLSPSAAEITRSISVEITRSCRFGRRTVTLRSPA